MVQNILKYSRLTNDGGKEEHFFWLRANKKHKNELFNFYNNLFEKEIEHKGYGFINSNLNFIAQLTKQSRKNKIIIHATQHLFRRPLLFWVFIHFFLNKKQKKNIVQVIWGLPMTLKGNGKGYIRNFLINVQCKAMSSIGKVVVLSLEDLQKAKQFYGLDNNLIQASYINEDFTQFNSIVKESLIGTKRIMVAHSAFPHNEHNQSFETIKNISDKDIEIICPLSYGEENYKADIIKKGKEIFGDKFTPLLSLLPRDEYHKLLASLNIYINHTVVQTSLYVIYFCVSTGVKMYLNKNNYNWMTHQGFKVNHVDELNNISFDEFVKPLPQDWVEYNAGLARKILSAEERAKKWRLIYS